MTAWMGVELETSLLRTRLSRTGGPPLEIGFDLQDLGCPAFGRNKVYADPHRFSHFATALNQALGLIIYFS
ncbi:hypothetical protein LAB1_32310 [Roseibium sp. LAB1]